MDAYAKMVHDGHVRDGINLTPPKPGRRPMQIGDQVRAMPDGSSLDTGIVVEMVWQMRGAQCPYDHPPLWRWQWRVTVRFRGGALKEYDTPSDFMSKRGEDFYPRDTPILDAQYAQIEAEIEAEKAAERA